MPFVVGENIGPYRIMEQLGRGGMATVFKAYHAALDRYVAIKALHPAFMEDPNFHARFQREARVVAKLEHPNIVPIYDFAEYEGRPYLVMKYINGETLKARLSEGEIQQDALIQIIEAVGAGLSFAHQKGILHRDIKPSNVLLANDGNIYLADFGLARIAQAGESTLSSDMMLGTPQYISPEQAMGLGELDERTDIYSFGVMLYEMAVGKVPFSADTPFSIIHDHIYTPLPLPSKLNPHVSEPVERVLLKALAKERDDRYAGADALAQAFTQAITAEPRNLTDAVIPVAEKTEFSASMPAPQAATIPESIFESDHIPPQSISSEISYQETLESESVVPEKPRGRFRLWYLPVGIVLAIVACYCGLVGLGAVLDWGDNGQIDPPAAEQLPKNPLPEPILKSETQRNPENALSLGEAQSRVDVAPDDPYSWLDLAEAQWAAGQSDEAKGSLNRALDLAGDSPDFYFETAATLAENEIWVEASHVYLNAIQHFYPGKIPADLLNEFHKAVYWAAEYQEAEGEIPIPAIAEVDVPIERVAKARYLLHFGDENEALKIVEHILTEIEPGMPEALYLQSEIYYTWGDVQASFAILYELQERDDTPDWIRENVERILQDALLMNERAQEQIDADPDNPYVYLPLYESYLGAGLSEQANETLQHALLLADGNPEFTQSAGEVAARNGAWLEAAQLFAHAGQLNPEIITPAFSEKIIQALYYGAGEQNAPEVFSILENFLPEDERGAIRAAYRDALIARYKLHYEDAAEAQALIEDVVNRAPILALPRLVQADVYLFVDDVPLSQAILLDLQNSRTAPAWVREEAQFMLEEIKP